jgi:hypothetical protein
MRFISEVPNSTVDEILTYNEILDYVEREENEVQMTRSNFLSFGASLLIKVLCVHLTKITRAQHSMCNVFVEWETGETTYEPLDLIASDDPVTCAEYGKKHNLLDIPGRKRFLRYSKNC